MSDDTPQFDQKASAMTVQGEGFKLLKQGDNYFSYAEWDKYEKMFKPEPQFVRLSRKTPDQLRAIMEETLFATSRLRQTIDKMHTDITANMENFFDGVRFADMTQMQKLRDDLDRVQNLLMEEAQNKNNFLQELNEEKEAKKTLEAQVKVLEKELKATKKGK